MIILPLQWDNHRGPDAIGQHKLTFTLDESLQVDEFNPMSIKKGTQFMVILIEDVGGALPQETVDEATKRFQRRMHALITELAERDGVTQVQYKNEFKQLLQRLNIIKESTKELDLQGYSRAINILNNRKNEN